MRPVLRGPKPVDHAGNEKQFRNHKEARPDLIARIGQYCSYCEMKLDATLDVEHVQPKKHHPDLSLEWNNFLLACKNCNSTKLDKDVELDDYFWPDQDNTFRAFRYAEGGLIEPADTLDAVQTEKAMNTIKLTGLDKRPLHNPTASDRRWLNRRETWDIAMRTKERLSRNNTDDFRAQIVETATGHAYWSVWMTVFQDDVDMLKRFIKEFPGTAKECFDNEGQAIPRPGGQI